MKICNLTLDDDLGLAYSNEAAERHVDLLDLLAGRLAAAYPLRPDKRTLILEGPTLRALEEILRGGDLKSELDLIRKVTRLANIQFGDHRLELTPGHMEELAWRAHKQGKTIDQLVQDAFKVFAENFFTYVK